VATMRSRCHSGYFPKGQYRADGPLWCPTHTWICGYLGAFSMSLQPWGGRAAEDPDRPTSHSSLNLVQRAEVLALADLDKPLHVATLAHTLAVSERTLRKAFKNAYGLSPCRHLRMLRLSRVRRALLSAHDHVVTVTKIATEFGFAELGRFSVEYRKVFGESPSVTLRRASRRYEKPNCRDNDLRGIGRLFEDGAYPLVPGTPNALSTSANKELASRGFRKKAARPALSCSFKAVSP
jgi:AraC-like DNA-binding protein